MRVDLIDTCTSGITRLWLKHVCSVLHTGTRPSPGSTRMSFTGTPVGWWLIPCQDNVVGHIRDNAGLQVATKRRVCVPAPVSLGRTNVRCVLPVACRFS